MISQVMHRKFGRSPGYVLLSLSLMRAVKDIGIGKREA
jgi:hypothetical protein